MLTSGIITHREYYLKSEKSGVLYAHGNFTNVEPNWKQKMLVTSWGNT